MVSLGVFGCSDVTSLTSEGKVGAACSKRWPPPPLQVEAYETDELNFHGGLRVSFGMQLMAATARIEAEIPSIKWPFLLLHGDADKLCDMRGSTMMYENTLSSDKTIKVGWGSSGQEPRLCGVAAQWQASVRFFLSVKGFR